MFRGREITYADQGYKILRELADQMKDIAIIEAHPKLEGKKMIMILNPMTAPSKGGAPAKPKPPGIIIQNGIVPPKESE
jgi:translation initiation factor IF-3